MHLFVPCVKRRQTEATVCVYVTEARCYLFDVLTSVGELILVNAQQQPAETVFLFAATLSAWHSARLH